MSPIFVLGLLVSVFFCGLTVDIGRMELKKVQLQTAADAAALGAELESERGVPGGVTNAGTAWDWVAHGKADAALNGFTDGQNGTTVTIVQNPTSGAYAGRYDAIQATVSQTYKTIFMGVLNSGRYTLSAQAIALVPTCTYFLGAQSASYSYSFNNASAGLNSACPVYSGYSASVDAFAKMWGFGLNISGPSSSSLPQGWMTQVSQGPGASGNPAGQSATYNAPIVTDPLSYIPHPTTTHCDFQSYSLTSGSATLNPGTYCGSNAAPSTVGMNITNASVTLNPGLYYITGGVNWQHANVTGTGVTLFFSNRNGLNNYGQVNIGNSGGASVITLSAPTDSTNGAIPGILFFADRRWISTASMDFNFGTYGSFTGDGIWYLPNTGLYIWLNGTFSVPHYGSLVVRNTYIFGTSVNSNGDYSWLSGGSPFRRQAVLVQ